MHQPKSQIETPTDSYVTTYPWAIEHTLKQQALFWFAEELGVKEDEQDFRTKLTEGELHGILTAQSILTQYELMIGGQELWGGKIAKLFPRPEIQRMCACFSNVELGSHAPFYDLGNKVMGTATDEFYTSWKKDPVLSARIEAIEKWARSDDALEVTAALAFLEGAVLYSIFGYFKGFNSRGFNLIPHFVSGIDGSAKDEDLHSRASAELFQTCRAERIRAGTHSEADDKRLRKIIKDIALKVIEHERAIIEKLFAKPGTRVIQKDELVSFLEDRINVVMVRLGQEPLYQNEKGELSTWFYQQLSSVKVPDFFAATQLQYVRNWNQPKLNYRKAA
jgi:ribonucleotide reductase beta subunit family protein with ferritin-like domain